MNNHTLDVSATIFEALRTKKLGFITLKNEWFAQAGDTITCRKISSSGGFETEVGNRFAPIKFVATLGFAIPGGTMGIEPGVTAYTLEYINSNNEQ